MNYFVIIGGSESHVPFIEAAKKLDYNTVIFDHNPNCPGAKLGDIFFPISTNDVDSLLQVFNELKQDNIIKGVMTYSSNSEALMTTAKLCQTFHLSSCSIESAELSIDKHRMKKRFVEYGVPTPLYVATARLKEARGILADKSLPWILKPSSGCQGSLGISIVQATDKFNESFTNAAKYSTDGSVIAEEYYTGREFSVDGIVTHGTPIVFAVSEKFNLGYENNFTISGFTMGLISGEDKYLRKNIASINDIALAAVRALKIDNSFFSVDVILSEKGPLVLECGILLDAKIDRLLNFAGVNVYERICKVASGEKLEVESPSFQKGYALKFMFATREGKLKIVHRNETNQSNGRGQCLIEWERDDEDLIRKPKSIADTIGWIITEGVDQRIAYRRAAEIHEQVHFKVI